MIMPGGAVTIGRPDIRSYRDFRAYLADLYEFRHRRDRKFNKSLVCRRIGLINSRGYFNSILRGRVLSRSKTEDFIRAFDLDKDEAHYFRLLVKFNQAMGIGEEQLFYLQQLQALGESHAEAVADGSEEGPYRVWYHAAVLAVLGLHDIRSEHNRLAGLVYPRIAPEQAEESIRQLAQEGKIRRDARGYWKPAEILVATGP